MKELIVLGLERTTQEIQIVRVNNGKMEVIKGFCWLVAVAGM